MRTALFTALLPLLAIATWSCRGLQRHADLLVGSMPAPAGTSVRVTYLGCNGFLITSGGTALLVDPCFTRPGLLAVGLNRPIPADVARIESGLDRGGVPEDVDAILVTHAHYDHLLDVPHIRGERGGVILASPTGCFTARAHGVAEDDVDPVLPGAERRVGDASVRVIESAHDRVLCRVPFPGEYREVPETPPARAREYLCGQPLAYLIELGGRKIYVDSGGRPEVLPPVVPGGIDLALIGAALPDSRARFVRAVERLQPRLVYPTHQDNFFRPVDKPYRFNFGTNFPALRREFEAADTGAEMILFDFFQCLEL